MQHMPIHTENSYILSYVSFVVLLEQEPVLIDKKGAFSKDFFGGFGQLLQAVFARLIKHMSIFDSATQRSKSLRCHWRLEYFDLRTRLHLHLIIL
jgi:hypothetical protein